MIHGDRKALTRRSGLLATLVGAIMLQETRRSADLLCDDDHDGHAVAVDTTRNVYLKTLRVPNFLLIIVLMCCQSTVSSK